eukprot:68978_1
MSLAVYPWYGLVNIPLTALSCCIVAIIVLVHSYNICLDLCTKSRKSLSHYREKPKQSTLYKSIAISTYSCLLLFLLFGISSLLLVSLENEMSDHNIDAFCSSLLYIQVWTYYLSKLLMYAVFLLKIYVTYNGSAFAYSPTFLIVFCVIISLNGIFTMIFYTFDTKIKGGDKINGGNYCMEEINIFVLVIAMLTDFIVNIVFLILFIRPLRKIINRMDDECMERMYGTKGISNKVIGCDICCMYFNIDCSFIYDGNKSCIKFH